MHEQGEGIVGIVITGVFLLLVVPFVLALVRGFFGLTVTPTGRLTKMKNPEEKRLWPGPVPPQYTKDYPSFDLSHPGWKHVGTDSEE